MMKSFAFVSLLLLSPMLFAQKLEEKIHITGEAEIEIPADQVLLTVHLQYKDYENVQTAFNAHKAAEQKLVKLVKDLKISGSDVQYSLISFSRQQEYTATSSLREYFVTTQTVNILLKDLKSYPDILIKLVNSGFTNVSTGFTSSKGKDFPEELLTKAVEQARKKAEVIAKASGRKLGKVTYVGDAAKSDPIFRAEMTYAKVADSGGFISEYPQTIKKSLSLEVIFELY